MFISKYTNQIDKKGRVSVPSSFRSILNSTGIVLYPSIKHECIEGCSMDRLEKITDIIQNLDPYSDERDAFETVILSESSHIPFDNEGRIILPKHLIEYAGIEEQGCFVGKGFVFEIWHPEGFASYLAKARSVAKDNRLLLKNI